MAQGAGSRLRTLCTKMQQRWADSIGRNHRNAEVRRLPSGAGHDAMVMGKSPQWGMLFVALRQRGISHHPSETLSAEDADVAASRLPGLSG